MIHCLFANGHSTAYKGLKLEIPQFQLVKFPHPHRLLKKQIYEPLIKMISNAVKQMNRVINVDVIFFNRWRIIKHEMMMPC
jgi:hypothetical protein